jgi:cell wall-associated protease
VASRKLIFVFLLNPFKNLLLIVRSFYFTLFGIFILSQNITAQTQNRNFTPGKNWYRLDPKEDKVQGLSIEKAYNTVLKNKTSKTVLVAVIDSGIDINHEDLKDNIWINEYEIPGNGIDDDENGYIDDINGWSFLGGKDGDVKYAALEFTRIYKKLKLIYESDTNQIDTINNNKYELYKEVKDRYLTESTETRRNFEYFDVLQNNYNYYNQLLRVKLNVDTLSFNEVLDIESPDSVYIKAKQFMLLIHQYYQAIPTGFEREVDYYSDEIHNYNIENDERSIVGDNPEDPNERYYGNNNVIGPDAEHGTHVSGIIGAIRDNNIGIKGIADNVKIMAIRAVPNGDERDKDVANAIRYAVDNGAQIINMSFGKFYSPDKIVVDEAVKYAEQKGVLMVHGSGNENLDTDKFTHYPSRILNDGSRISTWIEVGATTWKDDKNFVADFSNYGQHEVDIFGPGVDIYSCTLGNTYEALDGTSMAAPTVTGVAALLMSYYPHLRALEVKNIIKKSAHQFGNLKVIRPGTEDEKVRFSELSDSGGLVNAYDAILMAESLIRTGSK